MTRLNVVLTVFLLGMLPGEILLALALAADRPTAAAEAKLIVFPPTSGTVLVLPYEAYDGDTVRFYWLIPDSARLDGINAPEVTGPQKPAGLAARDYLRANLPAVPVPAELRGRDKFGRALLILRDEGGRNLSEVLIEAGHGKPWDGKGARP